MHSSVKWMLPLVVSLLGAGACGTTTSPTRSGGTQGTGGSGGDTSTTTGGGGVADGETRVGEPCDAGADCGSHPDSFCVSASDSQPIFTSFWGGDEQGGGVAGGYCTRSCSSESPCPEGSRCGGGICLALCDFGSPDLPSFDAELTAEKCHGRDDLMCVPTAAGDSVCMPNCGAGADCEGRACDGRFGVCTNPDRSGDAVGVECVMDNATTEENEDLCAGLCLEILDDDAAVAATVCSSRCSMGGSGADCGGPELGVCAIARVEEAAQSQLGDVGFCASACDAHDACAYDSGLFCLDLGNHATLGKGYCIRAQPCDNGEVCADGQACTETAGGKVCLDDDGTGSPLIPLGAAAL